MTDDADDRREGRAEKLRAALFLLVIIPFGFLVLYPVLSLIHERTVVLFATGLFDRGVTIAESPGDYQFVLSTGQVYDMGFFAFLFMCTLLIAFFFVLSGLWLYLAHKVIRFATGFKLLKDL